MIRDSWVTILVLLAVIVILALGALAFTVGAML